MVRCLDCVFFIYFASHIPITIFIDSQALFPKWLYPPQLTRILAWYCRTFKDPLMCNPPTWFLSFVLCEIVLQFPFFFLGTYAYYKGAEKCQWIRLPVIVYGSHVSTTVITILCHIMADNFRSSLYNRPQVFTDRLYLSAVYLPYLFVPLLMMLDGLFSDVYTRKIKQN